MWNDFTNYLSNRPKLGGELFVLTKTPKLKSFIKKTLANVYKTNNDISDVEKRWTRIYTTNQKSGFYRIIKNTLDFDSNLSLEHGCSIGLTSNHMAKKSHTTFGIDKSYYAIQQAKNSSQNNLDFFVADSLEQPFGKTKFDLVVGLNLFEIIEPKKLLKIFSSQTQKNGYLVLSDPYDFERGEKSIKEPLYEDSLRQEITRNGFTISKQTQKPSFHTWTLKLHGRAHLQYKVDLIVAKKS